MLYTVKNMYMHVAVTCMILTLQMSFYISELQISINTSSTIKHKKL